MKDEKVKKEVKKEKKDDGATLAYVARRVDKIVKWLEDKHGADVDGDGSSGYSRVGTMVLSCLVVVAIGLGVVFAENIDTKSAGTGTYSLDQASNGTGDITLTVDAVAADVTGAVTATTISASGVVTTSADVDMDATGGTTGDPDFSVDGWAKFNGTLEVGATARTRAAVIFDNLPFTDPGVPGQLYMTSGGTAKISQ